ncbi:MAG: hypothetical protein D3926_00705 [Desulfobacteraceae bacterium]|nr:MAG: hypothetical protein D3926_00705 [Desulfobacteraceae bacterium]
MKQYVSIIISVVAVLSFNTPCLANPLSNIFSFFQRDLVVNVLYKNHQNLIQGSKVFLAQDPKGQKVLIGKVERVYLSESELSNVEIIIEKKYRDKIFDTTPFVLMSNRFSKNPNAHIVAVSLSDASDKMPLESGASVNGVTYIEYKIATAGEDLKKIMDSIKKQNDELLGQLESYIDAFDTDAFHKKMDDLANQMSEFSTEQKEIFKNEVLPSLRKKIDEMMEKLQEQNNKEKSKELEKQLEEIEGLVNV